MAVTFLRPINKTSFTKVGTWIYEVFHYDPGSQLIAPPPPPTLLPDEAADMQQLTIFVPDSNFKKGIHVLNT